MSSRPLCDDDHDVVDAQKLAPDHALPNTSNRRCDRPNHYILQSNSILNVHFRNLLCTALTLPRQTFYMLSFPWI